MKPKVHFSRKCGERPFEHIASLLSLMPSHRLSIVARDHVFEMVKISVETLALHLAKPTCNISPVAMERLMNAAMQFPVFTEKQKQVLTQASVSLL